jgi:3-oxoadipate enol-lactonase
VAGRVAGGTTGPTDPGNATPPASGRRISLEQPAVPGLLLTGAGVPVTVFAPGLGASLAETRPFGSGVPGTRAFLSFRGLTYADLAGEVDQAADHAAATQALGVSLGAGAIMRLLAGSPDRFERVVLVLPASLAAPRPRAVVRRIEVAAELIETGDVPALADALLDLQPAEVRRRPDAQAWGRQRAAELAGSATGRELRAFADQMPLPDPRPLAHCRAPVLVVGQEGDDLHSVDVARSVSAALPRAELEIFPPGGLLWAHRSAVRDRISGFLSAA